MEKITYNDVANYIKLTEISSGKKSIYFVEKRPNEDLSGYTQHIMIYDKEKKEIHQFIQDKIDNFNPKENPTGELLAYTVKQDEKISLNLLDLRNDEKNEIMSDKNIINYEWNDNGSKLLILAYQEIENAEALKKNDPRLITSIFYKTGTDFVKFYQRSQIFIYDLSSKLLSQISDNKYNYIEAHWKGNNIIAEVRLDEPEDLTDYIDIVLLNPNTQSQGEKISRIFNPYRFKPSTLSVNQYNSGISLCIVLEQIYPFSQRGQIIKWAPIDDLNNVINKKFDRSISEVHWIKKNLALVGINNSGYNQFYEFNFENNEFMKFIDTKFSNELFTVDNEIIYSIGTNVEHPSALWRVSKNSTELLYDPNQDWLSNRTATKPEILWFTNPEGFKFQGWLFKAKSNNNAKTPLILSIHGGPHIMWNEAGTMWLEWQSQVSAGFSVVAFNPIGSDGYGEEFLRQICGQWGKRDGRDLLVAFSEVCKSDEFDTSRLYVTGGSYAGFQTINLIEMDHRFKAACSQRGVYNFLTMDAGGDIVRFWELEITGNKEIELERLWNDSPISKAKNIITPLLLIHSEKDYRVPIHQAEHLFAEIRKRGKEVLFVRYPDEGHELSRGGLPYRIIDRLKRMQEWFEDHK